jgi:hypothetical protein
MAKMIPAEISEFTTSRAERILFRELRLQLSDQYTVMHSVRWIARDGGRAKDGEADFLILHPELGFLVIECKGGVITRDPETDSWCSENAVGERIEGQDPFLQAERSMHALEEKLLASPATCHFSWPFARSVAFPESLARQIELPVHADPALIIDSSNLQLVVRPIREAMTRHGKKGPGAEGVKAAISLLRPKIELHPGGLAATFSEEDAELERLTGEQIRLLDALRFQRQMLVQGVAGSGKTVLAMEQARRLAAEGFDVLFTCFNKGLAAAVGRDLMATGARVTVKHFHQLAEDLARQAGVSTPAGVEPGSAAYFDEALPQMMMDAVERLETRFDAIVVDEGQDFADIWWVALESLFRDPGDRIWTIFYDDNQRVYGRQPAYPIGGAPFALSRNCRCTRRIQEAAARFCHGNAGQIEGPEGRPVEKLAVGDRELEDVLGAVLQRLVKTEGLDPAGIVVLTPRSAIRSALGEARRAGGVPLWWSDPIAGGVRCSSIHAFKGLEADVVILVECEYAHAQSRDALMYVAVTRARHQVVVIGELPR